ncbi:MAG: hypothetical protein ACKKL6_02600 [Candidatus Komeilibacteria bacterium]
MAEIKHLSLWKYLANFWSWLTIIIFIAAFFAPEQFNGSIGATSVIYASILGIYVSSKEVARWRNKDYVSNYYGEIYVLIWTIIIVGMILISIMNHNFVLQPEFTATYITILGIFAISQKSKALKG